MKLGFKIISVLSFLFCLSSFSFSQTIDYKQKYIETLAKWEAAVTTLEKTTLQLEEANKKIKEIETISEKYSSLSVKYIELDKAHKDLIQKYEEDTLAQNKKFEDRVIADQKEIDTLRKDAEDLVKKFKINNFGVIATVGYNISGNSPSFGIMTEIRYLQPIKIFLGADYSTNNQFVVKAGIGIEF